MSRTALLSSSALPIEGERLLTEAQLSERLGGVAISTIRKWRLSGRGPAFLKLAGSKLVRYDRATVDDWLARCARISTADPGQPHKARDPKRRVNRRGHDGPSQEV